jgi:hypothetical protein
VGFSGVSFAPRAVAVADVNGDGRPDLVVANHGGNNVSVLLGKRNAATHFKVSAPASATAGTHFKITVTAKTAGNQLDALYTGTIHFTSSDGSAVLPANYTFTLRDAGSHTFTVTLNTAGSQTITATDTHTGSIKGKATVTVNAAAPAPALARGSGPAASPMMQTNDAAPSFPVLDPASAVGSTDDSRAAAMAALVSDDSFGRATVVHALGTGPNWGGSATCSVVGPATGMLAFRNPVHQTMDALFTAGPSGEDRRVATVLRPKDLEGFFADESLWSTEG